MTRLFGVLLLMLIAVPSLFSRQSTTQAPNPCADAQQKQLDFWVGEWDLTWPGSKAGEVGHGTNSIKRILDGCVVQENFSGQGSMPLRGISVSIFDLKAHNWKQTWVDNQGAYLDFIGEFKNGQMILQRKATAPNGAKTLQRMVWKNIAANEFDWSWEASQDDGSNLAGAMAHPLQAQELIRKCYFDWWPLIDRAPTRRRRLTNCERRDLACYVSLRHPKRRKRFLYILSSQ